MRCGVLLKKARIQTPTIFAGIEIPHLTIMMEFFNP